MLHNLNETHCVELSVIEAEDISSDQLFKSALVATADQNILKD